MYLYIHKYFSFDNRVIYVQCVKKRKIMFYWSTMKHQIEKLLITVAAYILLEMTPLCKRCAGLLLLVHFYCHMQCYLRHSICQNNILFAAVYTRVSFKGYLLTSLTMKYILVQSSVLSQSCHCCIQSNTVAF